MSLNWAIRPAHPVLQPLVSRYIGYEQDDVALFVHRGLPSLDIGVITFGRIHGPRQLQVGSA